MADDPTPEKPAPEVSFPVDSFNEALTHLRRPFTPEAVKWKVQNAWASGGVVVGYIDARLVIERLNLVCGSAWKDEYEFIPGTKDAICQLTVFEITRPDIGSSSHSNKGIFSDSFKRAAVKFGVGVSLYAMKAVMLNASDKPGLDSNDRPELLNKGKTKSGKADIRLTAEVEKWLAESYRGWLEKGTDFGNPLDHGDVAGSAGDLVEQDPDASPPVEHPSEEHNEKVVEIEKAYEALTPPQRKGLAKGKFGAQLKGAIADGPEALDELRQEITKRALS